MKLAYFPEQTALQSEPVWRAFLEGCKKHGIDSIENDINADAAVIWSVLWHGRLRPNLSVYKHFRSQNKPVFIIEVGSLHRGKTWKVSVNHITNEGIYGNKTDWTPNRDKFLNINLMPEKRICKGQVLIACQHNSSHQWPSTMSVESWIKQQVDQVRQVTDARIIVRQHPRCRITPFHLPNVSFTTPVKIPNTYDMFDINYNYDFVINYNSGVGIQAAIAGTPVIVDPSSLAYPVSSTLANLNMPDRTTWFQEILHTEWTVEEIAEGIPQKRLLKELTLI